MSLAKWLAKHKAELGTLGIGLGALAMIPRTKKGSREAWEEDADRMAQMYPDKADSIRKAYNKARGERGS